MASNRTLQEAEKKEKEIKRGASFNILKLLKHLRYILSLSIFSLAPVLVFVGASHLTIHLASQEQHSPQSRFSSPQQLFGIIILGSN